MLTISLLISQGYTVEYNEVGLQYCRAAIPYVPNTSQVIWDLTCKVNSFFFNFTQGYTVEYIEVGLQYQQAAIPYVPNTSQVIGDLTHKVNNSSFNFTQGYTVEYNEVGLQYQGLFSGVSGTVIRPLSQWQISQFEQKNSQSEGHFNANQYSLQIAFIFN